MPSIKMVDTDPHPDSPPTTAPSQALNLKTLAPSKLKQKRVVLPKASETEPNSPPPEPKQGTLQWFRSYLDLGDINKTLCKPAAVPKQKKSVNSGAKDKEGKAEGESGVTKWREWKVRHPVEMDVDPPAAGVQQKMKGKQTMHNQTLIIGSDSEIEIVDYGKGKGKEKVKVKAITEGAEGGATFVVPAGKSARPVLVWKRSPQNIDDAANPE